MFANKPVRRRGLKPDAPRRASKRRVRESAASSLFHARPRASRHKRHLILKTLLALILLLALGLGALYALPVSSLGRQPAPGAALPLPGGYTHVLLIGADKDSGGMFYNVDYDKNHDAFVSFVYGK